MNLYEGVPDKNLDTGLFCLVMVLRYLDIAADPDQITHSLGRENDYLSAQEIVRCAKQLGAKAKIRKSVKLSKLPSLPFLLIACQTDGTFIIIARADDEKVLIQDPQAEQPKVISIEELANTLFW